MRSWLPMMAISSLGTATPPIIAEAAAVCSKWHPTRQRRCREGQGEPSLICACAQQKYAKQTQNQEGERWGGERRKGGRERAEGGRERPRARSVKPTCSGVASNMTARMEEVPAVTPNCSTARFICREGEREYKSSPDMVLVRSFWFSSARSAPCAATSTW